MILQQIEKKNRENKLISLSYIHTTPKVMKRSLKISVLGYHKNQIRCYRYIGKTEE